MNKLFIMKAQWFYAVLLTFTLSAFAQPYKAFTHELRLPKISDLFSTATDSDTAVFWFDSVDPSLSFVGDYEFVRFASLTWTYNLTKIPRLDNKYIQPNNIIFTNLDEQKQSYNSTFKCLLTISSTVVLFLLKNYTIPTLPPIVLGYNAINLLVFSINDTENKLNGIYFPMVTFLKVLK